MGGQLHVLAKGWLPYTLNWTRTVIRADPPNCWTIRAKGDLRGKVTSTLTPEIDGCRAEYDWHLVVWQPALQLLAPLFRPLSAANHCWAMAEVEAGLKREMLRLRRARDLPLRPK